MSTESGPKLLPEGLFRRIVCVTGIILASPFFVWLALGLLPGVPSMTDVFTVPGIRWPASVTVLGLLMAAIGYWEP